MRLQRGSKVNYVQYLQNEHANCNCVKECVCSTAFVYNGRKRFRPLKGTYVWSVFAKQVLLYIIEHPDGQEKSYFVGKNGVNDKFKPVEKNELDVNRRYIYVLPKEIELTK